MAEPFVRRKENAELALLDIELEHLPPELRWREWMGRVEAVIFTASVALGLGEGDGETEEPRSVSTETVP